MLIKKQNNPTYTGSANITARPTSSFYKRVQCCIIVFCTSLPLTACGGLGYTPPPGAKLGDAYLSLTIGTNDRSRMPQGADIVISIENASAANPENKVIIGDVVKLSQADADIKINFPIDTHKLSECGHTKTCTLHVKVIQNGFMKYNNPAAIPYKSGQTKASLTVTRS